MNGVYERVEASSACIGRGNVRHAYRKWVALPPPPDNAAAVPPAPVASSQLNAGGWCLVLMAATDGEMGGSAAGDGSSGGGWLLIDPANVTQFRHAGSAILPSAGAPHWQRAMTPAAAAADKAAAVATAEGAAEERQLSELPWQVVALPSLAAVREQREREAAHRRRCARALQGVELPPTAPCRGSP
jgi:hypothetical protein